jgi:hypothetical protein
VGSVGDIGSLSLNKMYGCCSIGNAMEMEMG